MENSNFCSRSIRLLYMTYEILWMMSYTAFVASALPLNQTLISFDFFNEPITYITHQGLCEQV